MTKLISSILILAGTLQLACGDQADGEAPTSTAAGDPLGEPFEIIDGHIAAESNDAGLEAMLTATHNPAGSMSVTSMSGRLCIRGNVSKAIEGEFDKYWGLSLGFATARQFVGRLPAVGSSEPFSADPEASIPWSLGGRVIGIAATVTGAKMPKNLIFEATPGGHDPGGMYGEPQVATIYSDCRERGALSSGERVEVLFSQLENGWCMPEVKRPWAGDSVISFSWKVVADIVSANADQPDPYDFCLSDLQPILDEAP